FLTRTASTDRYPLSLHDALPILSALPFGRHAAAGYDPGFGNPPFSIFREPLHECLREPDRPPLSRVPAQHGPPARHGRRPASPRSEEHTSELQSRENLVCRLLLE